MEATPRAELTHTLRTILIRSITGGLIPGID